jgi:hypothetical protein
MKISELNESPQIIDDNQFIDDAILKSVTGNSNTLSNLETKKPTAISIGDLSFKEVHDIDAVTYYIATTEIYFFAKFRKIKNKILQTHSLWKSPKFKTKNVAGRLFDYLLKSGFVLYSDTKQTISGAIFWKDILYKYSNVYRVGLLTNGQYVYYDKNLDFDKWLNDDNFHWYDERVGLDYQYFIDPTV